MTADDKLSRALHDAVSGIEPRDALGDIRARTRTGAERHGWPLVLAGAVATAAIVATFAVVTSGSDQPEPGPAASPTTTTTDAPTEAPTSTAANGAVPLYFIGDTERAGPRLYREFQSGVPGSLDDALERLGKPLDPDYRTAWPAGAFLGADDDGDVITVRLVDDSLSTPPPGMSEAEAEAAIQQVVYTVQAVAQRRAPVQFAIRDGAAQAVLGVNTAEPVANAAIMDTLSHLNITTPEQGSTVTGDELMLTGVANSFEATVAYRILRGDEIVDEYSGTAEGANEPKLFPFSIPVDVSELPSGDYTVWASTDDPTGGEGIGAFTDSKQFTIQ